MTAITATDTTPRVWIGCLACYNAGRLVGDWHDANDADDVTTADVHGHASSHDEPWGFDTENIPARREQELRDTLHRNFSDMNIYYPGGRRFKSCPRNRIKAPDREFLIRSLLIYPKAHV